VPSTCGRRSRKPTVSTPRFIRINMWWALVPFAADQSGICI
jgi:hypothetical protein